MRELDLSDSFSSGTAPDQGEVNSTRSRSYATTTAYEAYLTAQNITLSDGHWFYNTTLDVVQVRQNGAWEVLSPNAIPETTFTLANGEAGPTDVTGLLFSSSNYKAAIVKVDIKRKTDTASSEVLAAGHLFLQYSDQDSDWKIRESIHGDITGVTFTITAAGQVQYATDTIAGANYVGTLNFKAETFNA